MTSQSGKPRLIESAFPHKITYMAIANHPGTSCERRTSMLPRIACAKWSRILQNILEIAPQFV